jgi:hypothetical protein
MSADKMSVCRVKVRPLSPPPSGELSDKVIRKCCFCEKNCEMTVQHRLLEKLSGEDGYYCAFCLRHGFQTRASRDVLILSFRGIIGHFYQQNYLAAHGYHRMWVSEVEDYIEAHRRAGEVNPLFIYDPETLLWFVNFARVGTSKKKVPLEEVLKTVVNILFCFDLTRNAPGVSQSAVFAKYKDAIENFYRKRYRPENRRMLIPTLAGCGLPEPKNAPPDRSRNFTACELKVKK